MRNNKLLTLLVFLIIGLFAVSGCDFTEPAALQDDEPAGTREAEYVEGELLVNFDEISNLDDLTIQEQGNTIINTASKFIKSIEEGEFNAESLLRKNEDELMISTNLARRISQEIGHKKLVEYDKNEHEDIEEAIAALSDHLKAIDVDYNYIIPNYIMRVDNAESQTEEISMHPDQAWHYEDVNAPEAWEVEDGSQEVRVAILDTGIDAEHESLVEYVDEDLGRDFTGEGLGDDLGHGTHVAGTVASHNEVSGVMQEATLFDVKVADSDGKIDFADSIEGIQYAIDQNADVMNMSYGGFLDLAGDQEEIDDYNKYFKIALDEGTLPVSSAGNDDLPISYYNPESGEYIFMPAGSPHTIAVGATDEYKERVSFSNYGDELDVMAPGVNIFSTLSNSHSYDENDLEIKEINDNKYAFMTGTSMSAPHVAGAAGLLRAVEPDITTSEMETILKEASEDIGASEYYGYGMIDTYKGISYGILDPVLPLSER